MNKSYLLGTTSLVAATVLAGGNALAEAQPLNLQLGGYYHFDAHLFDEDQKGAATVNNTDILTTQDAEINFNMRGELGRGGGTHRRDLQRRSLMKIGGRIELEASNNGDQIDQSWITLEAGWGRLDLA